MKKFATLLVGALLLVPSISFAQTEPSPAYNALVQQLIELLLQQVQVLQDRLAVLQEGQDEVKAETKKISEKIEKKEDTGSTPVEEESLPKVSLGGQSCDGDIVKREVIIDGNDWSYGVTQIIPKDVPSTELSFEEGLKTSINPDMSEVTLPGTRDLGLYRYKVILYKGSSGWGGTVIPKNKILEESGETTIDRVCE